MKKRILALLLATVLLILPLAACQNKDEGNGTTDASTKSTTDPSTSPSTEPSTEPSNPPVDPPVDPPVEPVEPPVAPTPVNPSVFSGTEDTSWYTGDKTEYVLTTADQLVGFQSLRSKDTTFEGVTIKLGCDMVLNEGTLEEIIARAGDNHKWTQLNSAYQFKGTFDGQGHVISGLYMKLGSSAVRGMFGGIGGKAVIKDFTLVNTYYCGPTGDNKHSLGAIAAKVHEDADVTISNVSVFATIEEGTKKFSRAGGFIGSVEASANVTMENCTFSGSISITGNYAGGMIGYASNANAQITLKNS